MTLRFRGCPRSLAGLALAMALAPAQAQDLGTCLAQLRHEAAAKGIPVELFDTATVGLEADESVLEALDSQPEFVAPIWEYMAVLVDERRITEGRRKLATWASMLKEAERDFGVDRHILVAVWGVETNYGRNTGRRPLLRSLVTTSCFGRRQPFFRNELLATLRILEKGDMPLEALSGSWAGAFGQTQFMPSTFQRVAVDFDGDGRRDIVASIPDALASTANYLKQAGWESGRPWGYEVRLPRKYRGPSGRTNRRGMKEWRELGVRQLDGKPLRGEETAALLLPAGARGPSFLVFRNFDAIHAYNPSESYALAIVHLADRLRGGGPLRTPWPTDDPALSRAERVELQEALLAQGFDVGEADGIIGPRTLEAIKAFQRLAGMAPDGYPGWRLLRAVRSAPL